jgi:L-lactate dehydrogenase complex protein LldG
MSAREDIFSLLHRQCAKTLPRPPAYSRPRPLRDLIESFAERARAASAEVCLLAGLDDVPTAIANILRSRDMDAALHVPPHPSMDTLTWNSGLRLVRTPPGPDDASLAFAPFAIAETGTLVHFSSTAAPASWHFRAGLEIAIVTAATVLPTLEDVLVCLEKTDLASTINLVTGPSRTADIEQTIELGAHGPKALSILVAGT